MAWDADIRFPCLFRMLAPSIQSDDVNLFFTVVRHVADMKVFGHDGRIDVDGFSREERMSLPGNPTAWNARVSRISG